MAAAHFHTVLQMGHRRSRNEPAGQGRASSPRTPITGASAEYRAGDSPDLHHTNTKCTTGVGRRVWADPLVVHGGGQVILSTNGWFSHCLESVGFSTVGPPRKRHRRKIRTTKLPSPREGKRKLGVWPADGSAKTGRTGQARQVALKIARGNARLPRVAWAVSRPRHALPCDKGERDTTFETAKLLRRGCDFLFFVGTGTVVVTQGPAAREWGERVRISPIEAYQPAPSRANPALAGARKVAGVGG